MNAIKRIFFFKNVKNKKQKTKKQNETK